MSEALSLNHHHWDDDRCAAVDTQSIFGHDGNPATTTNKPLCSVHLSSSHPTLDRSQCVSPRQQHNERSEPTFCRVYLTLCLYWYSRQKDFFITFTGTGTPLHTYTFLGLFLTLLSLYTSTTIYKIESWSFSTAVVSSPSFHLFAFLSTGTGRSLPFSLQCSKKFMQKHSQPVKLPNFITFGTVPPLLA